MDEREDIKGEAARSLERLEIADKIEDRGLAEYYAGSASHSYLRSIAAGNFKLINPKRRKLSRTK